MIDTPSGRSTPTLTSEEREAWLKQFLQEKLSGTDYEQYRWIVGESDWHPSCEPVDISLRIVELPGYESLGVRANHFIRNTWWDGQGTLEDLVRVTPNDLMRMPRVGKITIKELQDWLNSLGHRFGELPPRK